MAKTGQDTVLEIQDYLDATSDASKRTRVVTIVLVVASVLVLISLLNSLQSQWMLRRMTELGKLHGQYTESKLGPYPSRQDSKDDNEYQKAEGLYQQRYKDLCAAVARAYVENSLVIRVPFFGFSCDVNDLGLLGGIAFLVILGSFRFCISREVDNLRLSFEEAHRLKKLHEFYNLLAMRQVFTVPRTQYINRTVFLKVTPKLICWLPLLAHLSVTWIDFKTAWIGHDLEDFRFRVLIISELVIAFLLLILASTVTNRMRRLDVLWDEAWTEIQKQPKPMPKL